jgi:hypothetical protein
MGNQLAGAQLTDARTLLNDLENFLFQSELGGTRLLKTLQWCAAVNVPALGRAVLVHVLMY